MGAFRDLDPMRTNGEHRRLHIFGLWGMIPTRVLTKCILVASLTKLGVELLFLPVTLKVSLWLKRIENVDYFDKGTNFNPLKF